MQGRLPMVGRDKEPIIRGGFTIFPPEVEAALNGRPAQLRTAVIGRPVAGGDEEVLAFCEAGPTARVNEAEPAAHAAARLSAWKRPSRTDQTEPLAAAFCDAILKHQLPAHLATLLAPCKD
ncbi:hypothetical protein [Paracoccus salsus]|uniref:hypothetical protein n=1 Tax=Paracoccus salsus TaxID=2911061 RepID=UPI001F38192F|nr:hypothetical protein [Paracoccus salsus]MCF3973398.1 hypothetical protein [Paracoccus salsus]